MKISSERKKTYSWAMYDWADSAFATTVMAGFFPVFFKEYWSAETDVTRSTLQLGIANSIASIIVAILSPVLGAIADSGSSRKKFLLFFTMMGVVMTGGLYLVSQGCWIYAVILYALAQIGFSSGNIFYDSLLIEVAGPEKRDYVSALGYSLGYLGGGLLFAVNVAMTLKPELFGLPDSAIAVRISFLSVAAWWAIFSIPVFLFVDEPVSGKQVITSGPVRSGFSQLAKTFSEIRKLRVIFLFLAGYWLYIDGVDTIIKMAVDYGMSLGFKPASLIIALLITQFVGFPAALLFGKIGEKLGTKTGLFISITVYICVCIYSYFMNSESEFYVLAVTVGLVQGGIQSLSRSLYSRIIPVNKSAEFFGFYNMLGKFAAVIGPILMGTVSYLTGNPRLSVLSIIVLFLLGGILLYFVNEDSGKKMIV